MGVIPESHRDIVEKGGLGFVATLGPRGEPHNNPVWVLWDGENLRFSLTKTRQKYFNIKRNPRIAIALTDMDNPRRYLEVRGEVVDVADDDGNEFVDTIARTFIGTERYEFDAPGAERIVVSVRPEHTSKMG